MLITRIADNDKHKGTFLQKLQKSLESCKKVLGELQKSLRNDVNNSTETDWCVDIVSQNAIFSADFDTSNY